MVVLKGFGLNNNNTSNNHNSNGMMDTQKSYTNSEDAGHKTSAEILS